MYDNLGPSGKPENVSWGDMAVMTPMLCLSFLTFILFLIFSIFAGTLTGKPPMHYIETCKECWFVKKPTWYATDVLEGNEFNQVKMIICVILFTALVVIGANALTYLVS